MNSIFKILNRILYIFFIGFIIFSIINVTDIRLPIFLLVLCIFPLIMVPYILDKIKLLKFNDVLVFFYYAFLLLALVMGGCLGFYYRIWWFDLLCHFISGLLTSQVAFILLDKNDLIKKKYKWFSFFFIIIFSICIAGCWEFLEFTIDKFGGTTQKVLETGVNDTMEDMLIAALASIFYSFYYLYYFKKKEG